MSNKIFKAFGLSLVLLVLTNIVTAQQNQFTGVINNDKNQPLHWVNIVIPQLNTSAVSNEKGRFTLKNIPNGKYAVLINLLGYESLVDTLIFENLSIEKGYVLQTNSYELSEVKIVVDQQSGLQTNTPYSVSSLDIKNDALVGNPSGIMGLIVQDPAVYGAEMLLVKLFERIDDFRCFVRKCRSLNRPVR